VDSEALRTKKDKQTHLNDFRIKRLGKKLLELVRRTWKNPIKAAVMEIACTDVHLT